LRLCLVAKDGDFKVLRALGIDTLWELAAQITHQDVVQFMLGATAGSDGNLNTA
jgi:hypothetical protein